MTSDYWLCGTCRSVNVAASDRCYACRAPAPMPERLPVPGADEGLTERVTPARGPLVRTAALVALLAIGTGSLLGLLAVAVMSPPSPAQVAAAATSSPGPAATAAPPSSRPTPTAVPSAAGPSSAPSPTPTPAFAPYLGRLSGVWLLNEELEADARAAGAYPVEFLLRVRPRCDEGACPVTASLLDARTGKTLASEVVKPTADGYRLQLVTSTRDLCRATDGRTVADGAQRVTTFVLRPFTEAASGDVVMVAEASIRLRPTSRGRSVGCADATVSAGVSPERVAAAKPALVAGRLSPVPIPDLVGRPSFTVSIRGVRSIYFSVKGTSASQLMDRWARTSSREFYCGRIDYSWYRGSGQTLSCIKASWRPRLAYVADPWNGSCRITGVRMKMTMSMPIAEWTGPGVVPRGLVTWWKATQRYVRDHEAGHVTIYRQWIPKLVDRVVGADCQDGGRIIRTWNRQVAAAQEAYDKREYARTDWPPRPADAP